LRAVKPTYAVLQTPGSSVGDSLARRLEERGAAAALLDLDAPLRGEPVTVRPGSVVWQAVDLTAAAAVLVERPVFPWPQPQRLRELIRDGAPDPELVGAEREARSLIAAAIPAVAEAGRVVNPPHATHLAASPAIALDGLESAGLAVHPWRLAPAPDDAAERLLLDAAGRDLWHEPGTPPPGEMAIEPDPFDGEILSILIAGGSPLGGLRHADGPAWLAGEQVAQLPPEEIPTAAAALAGDAVKRLGLDFAAVALILAAERPGLLWLDAGPDLAAWDEALEGRVAAGLADYLIDVASGDRGRTA
jgi:hypothetical protein